MTRVFLFLFLIFVSVSAQAADDSASRDMYHEVSEFAKKLNPEQTRHFYLVYNNYNLIKTVETVRGDVSKATDSCSKNNPDMVDKMQDGFKSWSGAIDPALKKAKDQLAGMVMSQDYADPKKIRHIFDLVDDTREQAASDFSKTPVSTPEACQYLLDKMDSTQEGMLSLLNATLVSYPQSLPAKGDDADQDSESFWATSPPTSKDANK